MGSGLTLKTPSHSKYMSLIGKRALITGGSRGIGLAIGKMLSANGCSVAIAAKTTEPHPKLPGTIYTAADECADVALDKSNQQFLPLKLNIMNDEDIQKTVDACENTFGGLDILINNASAISNTSTLDTSSKKYDLMHTV